VLVSLVGRDGLAGPVGLGGSVEPDGPAGLVGLVDLDGRAGLVDPANPVGLDR
jgi:hypothetical protein